MSDLVTPDVLVAALVGAMQGSLVKAGAKFEPTFVIVFHYLSTQQAKQSVSPAHLSAMITYLKTPPSGTAISNAIGIANQTIRYLKAHPPALGSGATIAGGTATHSPRAVPRATIQKRDEQTTIGQGTSGAIAAAIGAGTTTEPGLESDELGNALAGGFAASGAGLIENLGEALLKEGVIAFLKAIPQAFLDNLPTIEGDHDPDIEGLPAVQEIINPTIPVTTQLGEIRVPSGSVTVIEEP